MGPSDRREVACALLLDARGRLLLQRRDDIPGILQPGKLSLFGGHREDNETFLECVVREIEEEIGHAIPAARFVHLSTFNGADPDRQGGTLLGEFFVVRHVDPDMLVVIEGRLQVVAPEEFAALDAEFTPMTRFVIEQLYGRKWQKGPARV
jgi:8-oxo-dGTP pyrophosphatase MutT (NUDIX family)